jgi:MFS transporter, CP family, cyanate transporter
MALQAMMSFSVFVWMAPILRSRGLDGVTAGLIVSISIALQMGGSLGAPAVAARLKDQFLINVVVTAMAAAGFALTSLGPMEGIWLWTGLLGLGQGSLTAVALTMIVLRTRDEHGAGQLSGMMQCVGYGIGSSGTFLVGQLHAWTGGYAATAVRRLSWSSRTGS